MRKLKEESEKEDISINNSETIPKHFENNYPIGYVIISVSGGHKWRETSGYLILNSISYLQR